MKKILFSLLLAVIAVGIMSCKDIKPTKTAEELMEDSLRQAYLDSLYSDEKFKKESIVNIEKYIKRWYSSDPDFGKVIETKDYILNDTFYFAKLRIVIMNRFGAKEQIDDIWGVCCYRDKNDPRMFMWTNRDNCEHGLKYMTGKDCFSIDMYLNMDNFQYKIMDDLCNNQYCTVKEKLGS